jgi:peptide deformylase
MLSIVKYPDPVLEKTAEVVKFPLDNETKILIKNMWQEVREKGVGLAAPQVGVSKQICIIYLSGTEKGKQAKDLVLINPKITFRSQAESLMIEGCLSFPGEYWEIWRPSNINVEYFDEKGKKKTLQASGWLSRVIQHEVDHLQGKLFINLGGRKLDEKDLHPEDIVD